ncbi:MAG: hydrogenase maturation protease [Terracidiphilus sp.]|jgi:hydrogenase maturation protease
MLSNKPARCLILACGNTLRGDDGVGPRLAEWAEERFAANDNVRVLARQQWTPDLAEEIALAESVLFVDSSIKSVPGRVDLVPVDPHENDNGSATHHLNANELMGLACELFGSRSAHSMLLTIGAGSTKLGESFSDSVEAALPRARGVLEKAVLRFLEN